MHLYAFKKGHQLNCDNDYEYMYTLTHVLLKLYFKIPIKNAFLKGSQYLYYTQKKLQSSLV